MKIGLVLHPERARATEVAREVLAAAAARDIEVVAADDGAGGLPGVDNGDLDAAELILSIGGDGTVLEAISRALPLGLPVLGINSGRVGFLAEIEEAHVDATMDRIAARDWDIEERMTLKAEIEDGPVVHGLNDIVISKRVLNRLATLVVTVDGEPFRTYRADGIVVASPTGSTAYSFSAGGPAVDPRMRALLMTAVAPHSLFSRTLIFGDDRRLSFRAGTDRPVGVEVDAAVLGELEPGQSVHVSVGDQVARFATMGGKRFPQTLKHKLGLDGD
ncbi:MAG: NAD(+)/NADH kinase [Acidimicrobiia bacterium]|nr:NAD(+)/NADH kinase [Acidimicrobiia bacterium]NNF10194.1 NAD(+)/NADH kinase [Acidimicrobiia bacterium]NNL69090.1 NAD(+)/NADH kinase [Acidimicrobiia bacterium]